MTMGQIRTTISLDEDLHKQLSLSAVSMGATLSNIVNWRLANRNFGQNQAQVQAVITSDLDFFAALSKKIGKTNWAKLIREERDRDAK